MSEDNTVSEGSASQSVANKVLRVLGGKRLKYTITIHFRNGEELELQSDDRSQTKHDSETRTVGVHLNYDNQHVCDMADVLWMHCEENPT